MTTYHQNREEFIARFLLEATTSKRTAQFGEILHDARTILRLAGTHARLSVEACNRELEYREAARLTHIDAIDLPAILKPYGFTAITGGDPRGYTVKILFPSGIYNTLGGAEEGYGVPTRH